MPVSGEDDKWAGAGAFLAGHPVFTHEEFVVAHTSAGRSRLTSSRLLAARVSSGRLIRVRRGLYATVPPGLEHTAFLPDPFLVAARAQDDGVLAYHTALAFHGAAHSAWWRYQAITASRTRRFTFGDMEIVAIMAPRQVRALPEFGGGLLRRPHAGGEVRVTTIERTLVDLMHAPQHGGGWEEIWRSLESIEFVDPRAVAEYALRLGSALTAARVGFFLEQQREHWMIGEVHLEPLLRARPKHPLHWDRRRESGTWVPRWGLVIPPSILERRWEEPR